MKKRSIDIDGHRTSVSLEEPFWAALKMLAGMRGATMNELIATIDGKRKGGLSSAIRVFVLAELRKAAGV